MLYFLMHKDDAVCLLDMSPDGIIENRSHYYVKELLPLPAQKDVHFLQDWITSRAISKVRHGINKTLAKLKLSSTSSLLLQNLGLSLTDCYWFKPVTLDVNWSDVNMYVNDFSDALYDVTDADAKQITHTRFSPNSSLQGELQKKWIVDSTGTRVLLKGNYGNNWQQSLNENFASLINSKQLRRFPYVEYKLFHTSFGGSDAIICKSDNFIVSDEEELIPLADVYCSVKNPGYESLYQTCVDACVKYGLDRKYVEQFLSYQIELDYVISNTDRHFNNIGIIRDSDTLQFKRFAPIYDCGNSLFWNTRLIPSTKKEMLKIEVASFVKKEYHLLKYVKYNLFDCEALPTFEEFYNVYCQDPAMSDERIQQLYNTISMKADILLSRLSSEGLQKLNAF